MNESEGWYRTKNRKWSTGKERYPRRVLPSGSPCEVKPGWSAFNLFPIFLLYCTFERSVIKDLNVPSTDFSCSLVLVGRCIHRRITSSLNYSSSDTSISLCRGICAHRKSVPNLCNFNLRFLDQLTSSLLPYVPGEECSVVAVTYLYDPQQNHTTAVCQCPVAP